VGVIMLSVPVLRDEVNLLVDGRWCRVLELNTAACGLYVGLVTMRLLQLMAAWCPRDWMPSRQGTRGTVHLGKDSRCWHRPAGHHSLLIESCLMFVIIVPFVYRHQSPIFYLWQDWAFGVLHTKVICGVAML